MASRSRAESSCRLASPLSDSSSRRATGPTFSRSRYTTEGDTETALIPCVRSSWCSTSSSVDLPDSSAADGSQVRGDRGGLDDVAMRDPERDGDGCVVRPEADEPDDVRADVVEQRGECLPGQSGA